MSRVRPGRNRQPGLGPRRERMAQAVPGREARRDASTGGEGLRPSLPEQAARFAAATTRHHVTLIRGDSLAPRFDLDMGRLLGLLASGLVTVACVLGASRRATHAESADGPPPRPTQERTAQQLLNQTPWPAPEPDSRPAESRPGHVWVDGYWHWDGVRHVWIPPRWERVAPTSARDDAARTGGRQPPTPGAEQGRSQPGRQ